MWYTHWKYQTQHFKAHFAVYLLSLSWARKYFSNSTNGFAKSEVIDCKKFFFLPSGYYNEESLCISCERYVSISRMAKQRVAKSSELNVLDGKIVTVAKKPQGSTVLGSLSACLLHSLNTDRNMWRLRWDSLSDCQTFTNDLFTAKLKAN